MQARALHEPRYKPNFCPLEIRLSLELEISLNTLRNWPQNIRRLSKLQIFYQIDQEKSEEAALKRTRSHAKFARVLILVHLGLHSLNVGSHYLNDRIENPWHLD